jgi:hypothetical protein
MKSKPRTVESSRKDSSKPATPSERSLMVWEVDEPEKLVKTVGPVCGIVEDHTQRTERVAQDGIDWAIVSEGIEMPNHQIPPCDAMALVVGNSKIPGLGRRMPSQKVERWRPSLKDVQPTGASAIKTIETEIAIGIGPEVQSLKRKPKRTLSG